MKKPEQKLNIHKKYKKTVETAEEAVRTIVLGGESLEEKFTKTLKSPKKRGKKENGKKSK